MADPALVLVARVGAAHGLKGEVRLKAMTANPMAVAAYGELTAADGRRFTVAAARPAAGSSSADMLVVQLEGISDRTAAEALNNTDLYIPRARLPATDEDEFYHADLVGLAAVTPSGDELGTVIAVQNHGAGDILEVAPRRGQTILVPFTRAAVPHVDVAGQRIVVDPPPGILDEDGEDTEAAP